MKCPTCAGTMPNGSKRCETCNAWRESFARAALTGLAGTPGAEYHSSHADIAKAAWSLADAMLAARGEL